MNTATQNLIKKMCEQHPMIVCKILLETGFWPQPLETKVYYYRQSDDTRSQLGIIFSEDGDGWIEVLSNLNPDELSLMHRFRTSAGDGQSLRVHYALRILALAIHLDNEERQQPLLPFHMPQH